MSVLSGPPAGGGAMPPPATPPSAMPPSAMPPAADASRNTSTATVDPAAVAEVPRPAAGLELLGELAGSGYRRPPALVRRRDGQTLQLTRLLYLVLEAVDGERNYDDIA